MYIYFILQITIAAALGFDSFVVMRHGAGPLTKIEESKTEVLTSLTNEMEHVSLTKRNEEPRLGCYFCNDVVAPIDVISLLKYKHSSFIVFSIPFWFNSTSIVVVSSVNCKPYLRSAVYSNSPWTCTYCSSTCS